MAWCVIDEDHGPRIEEKRTKDVFEGMKSNPGQMRRAAIRGGETSCEDRG